MASSPQPLGMGTGGTLGPHSEYCQKASHRDQPLCPLAHQGHHCPDTASPGGRARIWATLKILCWHELHAPLRSAVLQREAPCR